MIDSRRDIRAGTRAANGYSQINRERIRMCNWSRYTRRAEVIKIDPAINPRNRHLSRETDLIVSPFGSPFFEYTSLVSGRMFAVLANLSIVSDTKSCINRIKDSSEPSY